MSDKEDYTKKCTPLPHHETHEDGGCDEIDCAGLTGTGLSLEEGTPVQNQAAVGTITAGA
ncbi:MAG: hypothetical protein IMZ61_10145 [Planctomycetes bacterium]|nr:hypothetical protein [Planctomycetota bacterium]